jgi:serine/threonine-protein kinase
MSDIRQYEPLWGSWRVDSLIGEGSFGKVYKARREEFGKTYYSAVKIISVPQNEADLRQMRSEGLDDASARSYYHAFVADIVQEIDLLSEFRGNSNIVSFEDHKIIERPGEIGWDILIRMELLTSLTDYAHEKPLSTEDVVKLGVHICRALEICAVTNTIHRDIKPDNIFVSRFGEYKLGDFGIARQIERTMSGLSKKGTYTYMAPEVFKGEEYGASVDTYSLGIVMYRFLNRNRTPFLPEFPAPITPRDRDEALQRRMKGETPPAIPGVLPAVNAIISKACAFDRRRRFSSPAEMREALEHARFTETISQTDQAPENALSAGSASHQVVRSHPIRSALPVSRQVVRSHPIRSISPARPASDSARSAASQENTTGVFTDFDS